MKKILALSLMLVLLVSCGNNVDNNVGNNKVGNSVNNIEVEDNIPVELTNEEEQIINEILEF